MKLKWLVSISLICAMSVSSAVSVYAAAEEETAAGSSAAEEAGDVGSSVTEEETEEISAEDVFVTWDESHVYTELTLGRYNTISTYGVTGYEDVPFISASDYLDILCEGKERIVIEDGVMKVTYNGSEAVIDPQADTIWFENTARFNSSIDGEISLVERDEFNVITVSVKNESTAEGSEPLLVSLGQYHMPVILYEDTVLMPFLALQNTFGTILQKNYLVYNGKDYYDVFSAELFLIEEGKDGHIDGPYMKAIHFGPFSEKTETAQAYADYGYYSICLLLDLTFGHKEEKNITTFDEYFTRMNAKGTLCSTNLHSAMTAEFLLFNYLFDSGHDSLASVNTVFKEDWMANKEEVLEFTEEVMNSEEGAGLFQETQEITDEALQKYQVQDMILGVLMEKGFKIPDIAPLLLWGAFYSQVRPENYGDERLDFAGDTAVIYFNAFKDDTTERDPSYYLDPIKEEDTETSTYAFFHECFEEIQQHDDVQNVVINLSDNGGGSAAALIAVLGFLSEDGEVKITDWDMLASSYKTEYYHVDTNLDGIADDRDGFGGQYDFYILCSGGSYSCGNALPYFAQKEGLAAIMGCTPGGGDCVVGYFVDAYGRCAAYSGALKLGTDDGSGFKSNEKAAVPDLNMMPSSLDIVNVPWFDPEGIADAVHRYQDGAVEMVYSDEEKTENMTVFLQDIMDRMKQKHQ